MALLVFAKAPVPGRVKTRLVPALGAWRAAHLHKRLTARALAIARSSGAGDVELHAADAAHRFFQLLSRQYGVRVTPQRGRDLGERMHWALEEALRRRRFAVLIGSDCPALAPSDLRQAVRLLRGGNDVVLSPAEDGGYVLIGLRSARAGLFRDMRWGGADVCAETVRRAAEEGLAVRTLRTLWDVDRPEDLERLAPLRWRRFRAGLRRCAPR